MRGPELDPQNMCEKVRGGGTHFNPNAGEGPTEESLGLTDWPASLISESPCLGEQDGRHLRKDI